MFTDIYVETVLLCTGSMQVRHPGSEYTSTGALWPVLLMLTGGLCPLVGTSPHLLLPLLSVVSGLNSKCFGVAVILGTFIQYLAQWDSSP